MSTPDTNSARSDGIYLLLLGCTISLFLGIVMEVSSPISMIDFKVVYYGARCVVDHVDPYGAENPVQSYIRDGHRLPSDKNSILLYHAVMDRCIYPPSALFLLIPLALLPFGFAQILWTALIIGGFGVASFLVWDIASEFAPGLSSALIAFLLANNVLVIFSGNPAGIVVSLCVFAAWCFVRQRLIWIGVICLAIAISFKPHDAIWVWSLFLLAGGEYRKRALQCALITMVLVAASVLWIWPIAPNWPLDLRSNLSIMSLPGAPNDPHFAEAGHYGVSSAITLQSALSYFRNDPAFYNSATYLICIPLLLFWAWITHRSPASLAKIWLAFAALLPLCMLPVYHRPYDAKLLMLTVPACAMLWAERKGVGRAAFWMTLAALTATGDLPWILLHIVGNQFRFRQDSLAQGVLIFLWVIPIPFILLGTGMFYLSVYARRVRDLNSGSGDRDLIEADTLRPVRR